MKRKRKILNKASIIINVIIKLSKFISKRFYMSILKLIRPNDSYLAMLVRFICLKNCTKKCINNSEIFSNVYFLDIDKLEIGDNVSIHPLCYIDASGEIVIDNDVSIAYNTTILSSDYIFSDLKKNIKGQGLELKQMIIENNVWVGAGCRILAKDLIRSASIIVASAIV